MLESTSGYIDRYKYNACSKTTSFQASMKSFFSPINLSFLKELTNMFFSYLFWTILHHRRVPMFIFPYSFLNLQKITYKMIINSLRQYIYMFVCVYIVILTLINNIVEICSKITLSYCWFNVVLRKLCVVLNIKQKKQFFC